jgi:glutaminyl-tRNA synthetase
VNETTRTPAPESAARESGPDFIRAIVEEHQRSGKYGGRVVTRFPPEPNGYLHIGHAKAIALNFGIAEEFGGTCHLRFDDTNPETEDEHYVAAIKDSVRWLGFDWGEHLYFASDYFQRMYDLAEFLVREGRAYVDSSSETEIRERRGTVTEPGTPSPYRDRSPEENLDLLRRMRDGDFPNGAHVLRARIDMASPNMLMRDPLLYRIRHAHHYRTGDLWCIYPMYDYAHSIEDAIECITHSLCTLEFENNRPLYDWVVRAWADWRRSLGEEPCEPRQYEFARGSLDYTVMSKRKFLALVKGGHVAGWDDPRMPTLAGLRRRGVTPEAILAFWRAMGVTKANTRVDIGKLEYAIRDDLNRRVPRVLCVTAPLRVTITNFADGDEEWLDAPLYPHDVPLEGSRKLPFSRNLLIERDDFMEDPPKGFHRLVPGGEVRLRYGYVIRCDEVVKDDSGAVVELRCSYDPETRGGDTPDGRRIRGTIHWVSADHALPCEVRLYDRLFSVPNPDEAEDFTAALNPASLVVVRKARIEPSVADDPPGSRYQFERQGYFCSDIVDSAPGALVFNRTVTLRDTWAKRAEERATPAGGGTTEKPGSKDPEAGGADRSGAASEAGPTGRGAVRAERSAELEAKNARFVEELGVSDYEAEILTRDAATADLFEATVAAGAPPARAANWILNEALAALRAADRSISALRPAALAHLIELVEAGTVSSSGGRTALAELVEHGGDPAEIVERKGLRQLSDDAALAPLVDQIVAADPDKVSAYRGGKTGLLGFFMGQVMARTGGRANPELARSMLEDRLRG